MFRLEFKITVLLLLFAVVSVKAQNPLREIPKIEPPIPNKGILPDEYEIEKLKGNLDSIQINDFEAVDIFGKLEKEEMTYSACIAKFDGYNRVSTIKGSINIRQKNDHNISSKIYAYNRVLFNKNLSTFEWSIKGSYKIEPNKNNLSEDIVNDTIYVNNHNTWNYDKKGNIIEHNFYVDSVLEYKEIAIYNQNNKIIDYKIYGSDGKISLQKTVKYDLRGNIIEVNDIGKNRNDKQIFVYDINNRIIEESIFFEGSFSKKYAFKYDLAGNKIEEKFSNANGDYDKETTLYQYNSKGKIISSSNFNYEGDLNEKLIYKYDIYNRLVEKFNENGNRTKNYEIYKYDNFGNIIEKKVINFLRDETIENFDSRGNLLEKIYINKKYNFDKKDYSDSENTHYKYEYDSNSNWVKRIIFTTTNSNTFPEKYHVTERVITYRK
jgi:hypothetical protein